jgi:calcineurin-like phosphoesterase family protein
MIKIDPNTNVFICSDTHFSHRNIVRGVTNWRLPNGEIPVEQTRDFLTIEKMNTAIVNNINEVVGQDDILIHLGDWSFGGFEQISEFYNRLVCKNIHLILGNHDTHIEKNRDNIQDLFLSVSHYNTLEMGDYKFILCHYPISSWDGLNKGYIHLHGHVHLPPNRRFGVGKRMDVGMDSHPEFRPYNIIREIVPLMKNRPIKSEMGDDHHTDDIVNKDKG